MRLRVTLDNKQEAAVTAVLKNVLLFDDIV